MYFSLVSLLYKERLILLPCFYVFAIIAFEIIAGFSLKLCMNTITLDATPPLYFLIQEILNLMD
jgi:hypothetical protein